VRRWIAARRRKEFLLLICWRGQTISARGNSVSLMQEGLMNVHALFRRECAKPLLLSIGWWTSIAVTAVAAPTFISTDPRLPNPDRPYVMESGNFGFPDLFVSGLKIWATNPAQLDTPAMNIEGGWEFDSSYDVAFSAFAGIGTGPAVPVMGTGTARATGAAGPDGFIFEPRVYQTEMLMLNLQGQVLSQPFMIRESPTLASPGVTTTQDMCPLCDPPFVRYQISSFFDVFTELSIDGGATWVPSPSSVRLVQTPEPASFLLLLCGVGAGVIAQRYKRQG
jgi:hypothetical protein